MDTCRDCQHFWVAANDQENGLCGYGPPVTLIIGSQQVSLVIASKPQDITSLTVRSHRPPVAAADRACSGPAFTPKAQPQGHPVGHHANAAFVPPHSAGPPAPSIGPRLDAPATTDDLGTEFIDQDDFLPHRDRAD